MSRPSTLAGLVVAPLLAWAAAAQTGSPDGTPQPPPSFRVGVDLVSLNVTATDSHGRFVTDLAQDEFVVIEDGRRQAVRVFDRSNLPVALSLLLDTSASMEDELATAQDAAVGFARRIREWDLAAVIDFDSRVTVAQAFTNRADDLERAIRSTASGGSTALYNAVYIALRELNRIRPAGDDPPRRQAVVVLSDGDDTSSLVTFEGVLDLARRSEITIFAIGLQSADDRAGKGFRAAEAVLRDLTFQTGGRAFFPTGARELAGIYGQIADELSSQYLIGYASSNGRRDGAWRRIQVQTTRPEVRARTRAGYFAPTEPAPKR